MTKKLYYITGLSSLLAFVLLIIMNYSWPLTEFSLNDVILGNVSLLNEEKNKIIYEIGINYALDTVFIFSWVGSWIGLFIHFKSLKTKLISLSFGLSFCGAMLDIFENTISFSLLVQNSQNAENILFFHSLVRDASFWLPLMASFVLAIMIPNEKMISNLFLKLTGILGVLLAVIGMYVQYLSMFPFYWFVLWFLVVTLYLYESYKRKSKKILI